MENSKEFYRLVALRFLANGVALLEDIEDLKETKLYSKQLKHYGNKFVEELEKSIVPLESALYQSNDIGVVNQIQEVVQQFNKGFIDEFVNR